MMHVDHREVTDPAEALAWALIDSGGQISSIVNHMLSSTPVTGDITTESGPFQVLHDLLSKTFAKHKSRPSARDLNTAVRVILWAGDVTAEEIFLVTPEFLEELSHTDHSENLVSPHPRQGRRKGRPRRPS